MSKINFLKSIDSIDEGNLSFFENSFKTDWVNLTDSEGGWTLLHYASSRFKHEILLCLLDKHKSDPNASDTFGEVALHPAARYNDLKSLKLLLDYGALPVVYNNQNKSPLNIATRNGSIECAKLLLPYHLGVKGEDDNYYFQNILVDAIIYDQLQLLDLYVQSGLNIHFKDKDNYTLAHLAIFESNSKILSYLLSHGAVLNPLPKHDNRELLQIAKTKKISKIVRQTLHSKI